MKASWCCSTRGAPSTTWPAIGLSLLGYMQGKRHWDGPERLAAALDGPPAQPVDKAEPEPAPWKVAPIDEPGRFDFEILLDDIVAHEEEARVEALITWLQAHPSIEETIHEDREFALVRARNLKTSDLEAIVTEGWGPDSRLRKVR